MFRTIADKHPKDKDFPQRTQTLGIYRSVQNGTFYDVLDTPFHVERDVLENHIPIADRRPSIQYNICKIVVDQSVSMLFGEGRWPTLVCDDEATRNSLNDLIKETKLQEIMTDAAIRGSVGSVSVLMRVLKSRVFFEVFDTDYLTPEYDPDEPDTLLRVTQKYKATGKELTAAGFPMSPDDDGRQFYFQRIWDTASELHYNPWPVVPPDGNPLPPPSINAERSRTHNLGFVPIVWIKNLPGKPGIDGECTFRAAIEGQIQIDHELSQLHRGLKYSCDPTLLIKEPAAGADGELVKGGGNALVVSKDGDAKLLEITGGAAHAMINSIRLLREFMLEVIRGNRTEPGAANLPQSGVAMERLQAASVSLADQLRNSYGENGSLPLLNMVVRANEKFSLKIRRKSVEIGKLNLDAALSLRWGHFFPDGPADKVQQATQLQVLRNTGLISQETGVSIIAGNCDIEDIAAELVRIKADEAAADARAQALAATVTASDDLEG